MEYQFSTTTLSYPGVGTQTQFIPEKSYLVGVVPEGNQVAIAYWEPKDSTGIMTSIELVVATDYFDLPRYGGSWTGELTPNRLRYLGHVTLNNGDDTYHVFEIQSEIFHPHDETVG